MVPSFLFSCSKCWAALKAIVVAKADLPIAGRPAKMIKSELCNPPNNLSMSIKPVGTPDSPAGLFIAF